VFLPKILDNKPKGEAIRVWIPGCSTGEEAYSVAIVLLEYLGDRANSTPIQVFGTDISESSVERARAGTHTDSSLGHVSPERLRRFFVRANGGYQVTKTVRERCIFARQDLAMDPLFSRLDLISCRNVLIYMGTVLQKKVISIFHYALKPSGFPGHSSVCRSRRFRRYRAPADRTGTVRQRGGLARKRGSTADAHGQPDRGAGGRADEDRARPS
jgi:chemotaxis methyl-accepting protein methylase